MYRIVAFAAALFLVVACSSETADDTQARVPDGDPSELPMVRADAESIRAMLRERFGDLVARNVRIEVEDSGGVRVKAYGEVPSDEIRVAVMNELSTRVQGLRFEDFDIQVGGPIGMLGSFDVSVGTDERFAVFSPDLSLTAAAMGEVYETATGRRLNRLGLGDRPDIASMAFAPDGKLLATGHTNAKIVLWDMPLGATSRTLAPGGLTASRPVVALQFTADGKSLVSLNRERGEIHVWDLESESARLIGAHQPSDAPRGSANSYVMAVSPDGETIASANEYDDGVILWDIARRSRRDTLTSNLFHPEALAWSKDGRHLAVARFNDPESGTVMVWDVEEKEARAFPPDRSTAVRAVAFSDDGNTLAVRYQNLGVRLWNFDTAEKWLDLPHEKTGAGRGLAFSPSGNVLATESGALEPAGIRLWNVSERPDASREAPRLPPVFGDVVIPRDDLLAQEIERAVRARFDPRNIESLSVDILPDGAARLSGQVSSDTVKDNAGGIAAIEDAPGEFVRTQRRVVNDLEVTGRYVDPPQR